MMSQNIVPLLELPVMRRSPPGKLSSKADFLCLPGEESRQVKIARPVTVRHLGREYRVENVYIGLWSRELTSWKGHQVDHISLPLPVPNHL